MKRSSSCLQGEKFCAVTRSRMMMKSIELQTYSLPAGLSAATLRILNSKYHCSSDGYSSPLDVLFLQQQQFSDYNSI